MNLLLELRDRNEILFWVNAAHVLAAAIVFVLCLSNTTQVLGINAYYKPLKFLLSSILFIGTMNWYLGYLPMHNSIRFYSIFISILFIFENVYITGMAARGEMSHFNVGTDFTRLMWGMMGAAATLIAISTIVVGFKFFSMEKGVISEPLRVSIIWGIMLAGIFAMEGLVMGSRMSHTVGAPDGGEGIPFLNWSKRHGDLRIAHFVGLHALQMVPLLSLLFAQKVRDVIIIALAYGAFATYTFVRAVMK
jgi:hypothetical protein